jgi:hypothetical protein
VTPVTDDKDLARAAEEEAERLRVVGDNEGPHQVLDVISDAPVNQGHVVPLGFDLRDELAGSACLFRISPRGEGLSRVAIGARPIVISGWVTNRTTGNKALEVGWKARGKWRSLIADRSRLLDSAKILALADRGFPVNAGNKANLIRYLAAYEERNVEHMPVIEVTEQMGWQRDGSFVAGRRCIGGDIKFVGADEGDEQLADTVSESGMLGAWKHGVAVVAKYPTVELALYASLAPPVLDMVGAPNFAIDWAYQTSSGKTTALRLAASVWGCPDERSWKTPIRSWSASPIYLERAAATMSHLPLIVDDTKCARKTRGDSVVPGVIYEIASGKGRGRGSVGGSRGTRHWRTIMLTTGEAKITDMSRDGGTAARALSLWGPPWGGETLETAAVIRNLNVAILANYGHAGPLFVEWLRENKAEAEAWRRQLAELAAGFAQSFGAASAGVAGRVSDYLALLELTGRLAHRALDLPWRYVSPVHASLGAVSLSVADTNRAGEALEHIYAWALGKRRQFWGGAGRGDREVPTGGWVGRWDRDTDEDGKPQIGAEHWEWIGFLRPPLEEELRRAGYDSQATISLWADRGWLSKEGRARTRTTRIDGGAARVIAVTRCAIEGLSQQGVVTDES